MRLGSLPPRASYKTPPPQCGSDGGAGLAHPAQQSARPPEQVVAPMPAGCRKPCGAGGIRPQIDPRAGRRGAKALRYAL